MLFNRPKGFVLIFVLWVLGFLTVLAVGVASGIRQKIVVLEKLDQRSRISYLLEASVKYAASYVSSQLGSGMGNSVNLKMSLYNNPEAFGQFDLGEDSASIISGVEGGDEFFGVVDEERKINLNMTTVNILTRLIERVLGEKEDSSRRLAESILDWRQMGESQARGFFSEEYYSNLEYPYVKKSDFYETLDELLLVKGITKDRYQKLIHYVTIYGDGKVNINTASAEVLHALGLEDPLIDRILEVRQGKDKIEATADDHIFAKTFDVATEVNSIIKLTTQDIHAIDLLNLNNYLTTNSYFFFIKARGQLAHRMFSKEIRVVFSSRENKILYWKER